MANQYTGNFEKIIQDKFNCSGKEKLIECANIGLTYQETAKILKFGYSTIQKWAKRYNIKLKIKKNSQLKSNNFIMLNKNKYFSDKRINMINILSKKWL